MFRADWHLNSSLVTFQYLNSCCYSQPPFVTASLSMTIPSLLTQHIIRLLVCVHPISSRLKSPPAYQTFAVLEVSDTVLTPLGRLNAILFCLATSKMAPENLTNSDFHTFLFYYRPVADTRITPRFPVFYKDLLYQNKSLIIELLNELKLNKFIP